jgi:hypothetical protein
VIHTQAHFLYNSLSLINWKAIEYGQDDISGITLPPQPTSSEPHIVAAITAAANLLNLINIPPFLNAFNR